MSYISDGYEKIIHCINEHNKPENLAVKKCCNKLQLVAVSKNQSIDRVRKLLELGHRSFAESRLQEASEKWQVLRQEYDDIELRFIGNIQSKKVKNIIEIFDVIETIDREKIATLVASEMALQGRNLPCYIQVNIGKEPQKSGVHPEDVASFLKFCKGVGLNVIGLMCIPPSADNPAPYFALMQKIASDLGLAELSMGMSGDYATAMKFGATSIRVGTAIFGERGNA